MIGKLDDLLESIDLYDDSMEIADRLRETAREDERGGYWLSEAAENLDSMYDLLRQIRSRLRADIVKAADNNTGAVQ
jgi:hypothetical protein